MVEGKFSHNGTILTTSGEKNISIKGSFNSPLMIPATQGQGELYQYLEDTCLWGISKI